MSDYYEPWQPKAGQRVRINLGECHLLAREGRSVNGYIGHHESEHGQTGVVTVTDTPKFALRPGWSPGGYVVGMLRFDVPCDDGHRFCVRFDDPLPEGADVGHFAAIELEPVP